MDIKGRPTMFVAILALAVLLFGMEGRSEAVEPVSGKWIGGGSLGFISNTTDGTVFAFNLNFDRFLNEQISLGPLVQLGFSGDLTQTGVSGQGKYWFDLPGTSERLKAAFEGGIGFIHASQDRDDTSFLIPIGASLYYWTTDSLSLGATFLLNFTDLDVGFGNDTNIMPALAFGVRF